MVESALSPPYDGSEFEELFPELTGVEPDEMVDIESLADRALECHDVENVSDQSVMLNDNVSVHSLETNSDHGCVYGSDASVSEPEEEVEDADQLLRYLIGQTSQKSKAKRQRRQSSNDSGRFSDSSREQASSIHSCAQPQSPLTTKVTTRKYTKRNEPQISKPSTTSFTVINENGTCKSVRGPNRNAVMAKLNRERKKQLMADLEEKVGLLDTENDALKKQNVRLRKKVGVLARELEYVKGVLANQSTLSSLLKNIKATELEFHTSMPLQPSGANVSDIPRMSQKRKRQSDHDYCLEQNEELRAEKVAKSETVCSDSVEGDMTDENVLGQAAEAAGVCLHVSGHNVSLEFCSKCSVKSKSAGSRC